ncbi:pilus assembly protein [Desulfosediminicola flagellatus]|uniref:pilus assembly protein n=1 Tax=Desulfosediminicola flagellatus TaxID=2569541 RepID=UPI0010ACA184|nr:hypothetical protein [Desulfosediminicola flagellatus]
MITLSFSLNNFVPKTCFLSAFLLTALSLNVSLHASENYSVSDFGQMPNDITNEGVTPRVLINSSNDHQLYFKAYNDYNDLDADGLPETTYKHSIDYYGYFDSYKCYTYDTDQLRFEPASVTSTKYCNADSSTNQWSGNFLNWLSMSRIDTIRKILFGGHRRVDTSTETVLERSYLPHDAHSWAKYYAGSDIPQLTPFTRDDYYCDSGNTSNCEDSDGVVDWKKVGITLGNTTDVDMSEYTNKYSEDYNEPPLIKAVKGNYSLWASNERWQCTWATESTDSHSASNGNDPSKSLIYAYSNSPNWDQKLGQGNYVARVQSCVSGLIGKEKCKSYPGTSATDSSDDVYKPIGLLQKYGDNDDMYFGMIAGSYNKHASGGVLIRNTSSITDEINVDGDGTFTKVAEYAGGPESNNSASGLINAWSLYRIIGYKGGDGSDDAGTYNSNQGDNCTWELSDFDDVTAANRCRNWGNPFSEIYYQAINYFSGNGVIGAYRDNSSTAIPGLPVPQPFEDPLDSDSYCADLFVINLNTSTVSYDYDELDHTSYGPPTIWDEAILPGDKTTSAMTDAVGLAEGIHGNSYYVGENHLGSETDNQLCTEKTVSNLGQTGGICPEAPRLGGSYRIAGLAYYAHVEDIRPDNATGNRDLSGPQTIDTFSVALASGVPAIEIPDPENPSGNALVTILPACRNKSFSPESNCALVDFKIVSQTINQTSKVATGTFYINWEDSEQGGDFDQDMWGTLSYNLNKLAGTLEITTQTHAESTPYSMGFGYVIDGTNDDGFHVHSGIENFTDDESTSTDEDITDCSDGCNVNDPATTKTYILGTSSANLLKDPLWYASKYGGFIDSNDNKLPDLQSEWDSKINQTGLAGSDGIPDNYFYSTNPRELENSLTRVLDAILDRTSSGTAAAVVSNNVRGEGALYQAYYEPRRKDTDQEANWIGTIQALWLDSYGLSRQDCSPTAYNGIDNNGDCKPFTGECIPNGRLDNYCVDQVVETFFDDLEGRTRVKVYDSSNPEEFTALSMQGVVTSYSNGGVTVNPNSMEGTSSLSGSTLTITPYTINGTVTSYNDSTGLVEIAVSAGDWTIPTDSEFDTWQIISNSGPARGFSNNTISVSPGVSNTVSFTVVPSGTWITLGDQLTLQTKNMLGASGHVFDNWDIKCLEGSDATGTISNGAIQLNNFQPTTSNISIDSGDFDSCIRAQLTTYDLKGAEDVTFDNWNVTNLQTNLGRGSSTTEITLKNSGELSLTVSPSSNWLSEGDQVQVSNFVTTIKELEQIGYLWNAREQLYLPDVSDAMLEEQRDYNTTAEYGRYITTWIDVNSNNIIDDENDEFRPFTTQLLNHTTSPISHTFFDVSSQSEAEDLVNFIRGIEVTGARNRTLRYNLSDSTSNVMRLGDIINSTPTVVGAPQEGFNLLYYDSSYGDFRKRYIDRRNVIYVGGNDGLIHAFNGGFYNSVVVDGKQTIEYSITGKKPDNTAATTHPLGSEIWAYAPMNLLPHLQWLKSQNYSSTHVSYVDAKPRTFDVKIFDPTDPNHPNGWGTLLVAGMNLGGGQMNISVDHDNDPDTPNQDVSRRSAYVIIDITNPEEEPTVLGEIQIPDESFTTVYPAVVTFQDINGQQRCSGTECNRWYLMFGTGPNQLRSFESTQTAKTFFFDLKQLITQTPSPEMSSATYQDHCEVFNLTDSYRIMSCDSQIENTFMGNPVVVDWDLDFMSDSAYFGLVRDSNSDDFSNGDADSGRIMKFSFADNPSPTSWAAATTFFNSDRPISIYGQPTPSIDESGNHWLFFGSGRSFSADDQFNYDTQSLFGVKDYEDNNYPVTQSELLDVSDVEVYTDGTLETSISDTNGNTLSTFKQILGNIDNNDSAGWVQNLPPIVGNDGAVPSTRNTTRSALLGGSLFSAVFQPSEDPCSGEGRSRQYGLYYKTGTSYPKIPSIFGNSIVDDGDTVKYKSKKFIELGRGKASTPALHAGSGTSTIKVITQLSTGDIVQSKADPVYEYRAGRESWSDQ